VPYLAAIGTILFWASAFPAVKYALDYYSPESLMLFRFLVATGFLMVFCLIKKVPVPEKKDMPTFALSGFVGLFLYMWAFNTGTDFVPSGISGFIIASVPVFTLILSIIFLKEKSGLLIWIGVLVSFCGVALIAATQAYDMQLNIGVWILLLAAVCTSFFNILQRRILQKYSAIQATSWSVFFGTFFMLVFFGRFIQEFPLAPFTANMVVVYLGLFPAAIAYFFWIYALSVAEKTVYVTSFLYLTPFLASLMAFFWLGETLPPLAFVGGGIVVSGMVLTNLFRSKSGKDKNNANDSSPPESSADLEEPLSE